MVGNDVVDLADLEVREGSFHPRFDARVFNRAEQAALDVSGAPNRLRWMLWAAKEAAYKLLKKRDSRIVFSPARFSVELDASVRGRVLHGGLAVDLELRAEGDAVHALATEAGSCPSIVSRIGRSRSAGDASQAVRALAVSALSERLRVPPDAIRIGRRGRIPTLEVRGVGVPIDLSLSHHGRFIAVACDLGEAPA